MIAEAGLLDMLTDAPFWAALLWIIWINILLSGDNAVVIALACRSLPPRQMRWGIILGSGAAIVLRIVFTLFIVYLLDIPYLKIIGAVLLLWIGVKLLAGEEDATHDIKAGTSLRGAVQTVAIADAVMSLDNVIAIAGAAQRYPQGRYVLLVLGLLISIPLIVAGSALVLELLRRLPILVWAGAGLLGWIAGEIAVTDPAVHGWAEGQGTGLHWGAQIAGAAFVVLVGWALHHYKRRAKSLADIAREQPPVT